MNLRMLPWIFNACQAPLPEGQVIQWEAYCGLLARVFNVVQVQQRQSETLAEFLTVKGVDLNRALIKVQRAALMPTRQQ
jgi:hypothetical protein